MESSQELFSKIMQRSLISFTQVFTFRQTAHLAVTDAAPSLLRIERQYAEMAFSPANKDRYFTDPESTLEFFGGINQVAESNAQRRAGQFTSMVEAASLIYAHSLLDGIGYDLCVCVTKISPASWRSRVEQRKVALKDLVGKSIEEAELQLISEYISALEKESLPKKAEALFSVCRPPKDFSPFIRDEPEYVYDQKRLQSLDQQRHDLVHRLLPLSTSISPVELEFMQRTALYLAAMVSDAFGVKGDPRQMVQAAPSAQTLGA